MTASAGSDEVPAPPSRSKFRWFRATYRLGPGRPTTFLDLRGEDARHLDIAADPGGIEGDGILVTAHPQIHAGGAKLQIAQDHLVEKRRQLRVAQADFALERIELQPQRSFKQRERGRARPSLRRAGDGVERWAVAVMELEAAEQFGQTPQIHVGAG